MSVYFLFIPISWFLFKKYRIFNSEKANILTQPNKKKKTKTFNSKQKWFKSHFIDRMKTTLLHEETDPKLMAAAVGENYLKTMFCSPEFQASSLALENIYNVNSDD